MNRGYYILIVVLCLLSSWETMAQGKAAAKGKSPLAYEAFFKSEMEKCAGELITYRSGDKYYLEIPVGLLGRDFCFASSMNKGSWGNLLYTPSLGVAAFRMERDYKVSLNRGIRTERVSDTTSSLYRILEENTLQPIESLYPIEAYGEDGKSPIIDITAFLKGGNDWFSATEKGAADAAKSSVVGMEKSKNGVRFRVQRVYPYSSPAIMIIAGKEGFKTVEMSCEIRVLPEKQMCVRYADPRVGYQTWSFVDYGMSDVAAKKVDAICKWNLTVNPKEVEQLQKGGLVSPEKPIVFYIAPDVPKRWRAAIQAGIMDWNPAFEQAGFKNAIQVKEANEKTDLSSVDALVTYSIGYSGVSSTKLVDPRTGEILSCRLNIAHDFSVSEMERYLLRCGVLDDRIVKNQESEEVVTAMLKSLVSKEVGAVLGLENNLAGSAAFTTAQLRDKKWIAANGFTASVMDDCLYNYVVQPEDGVNKSDLFARVGAYDRWAIMWGYKQFTISPDAMKDKKVLLQLANSTAASKVLKFYAWDKQNPLAQRGDLASDKVRASELGLKNLERVFPRMEGLVKKQENSSWYDVRMMYGSVSSVYNNYVSQVATLIGGRAVNPVIKGERANPVTFTSKEEQQAAMHFLETYLFSGVPSWYTGKICVENDWLTPDELLGRFAREILKKLLSPDCVGNLLAAEVSFGEKAYTVENLFGDLDRLVFKGQNTKLNDFQRKLENGYVLTLVEMVSAKEVDAMKNDYGMVMMSHAHEVYDRVKELGKNQTDEQGKAHYRNLAYRIEKGIIKGVK